MTTEVEDGALTFLLHFTNAANAASWHQFTGYIPVSKSAVEALETEGWFEANPNSRIAGEQLAGSTATSATAGAIVGAFPAIRNHVTNAIEQVLVNDRDVVEAMTEAKELSDETLSEYNLLFVNE